MPHNPDLIVVGGAFATLQDDLLAGIRNVVYERVLSPPGLAAWL